MSILITGATGQLGTLIVEQLAAQLPPGGLIAGVRDLQKAEHPRSLGVEIRIADYDRPDTLREAFTGVNKLLFISSPGTDDQARFVQHTHVIEAAVEAGVGHIFYTGLAFPPVGIDPQNHLHLRSEQAIAASGLTYTFLRNALYTDIAGMFGLKEAVANGELVTAPGNWTFNTVTRRDLALGTAGILTSEGHEHKSYELTAPQTWDFEQLAEVLSRISGKKVVRVEDTGMQNWVYAFLSKLDTSSTSPDLEHFIGGPVLSLEESIAPFL